uniref:2'-5'-oligoadenylate synthase 1A-like isoform X2 n=1 Tax=Crassostrea virginica TaxID=6565 RepID=A0A8B8AT89_CRAVI|nr:2'-5'-oligoadenylate synthase 1A-like isoform X2 [Crassostrea virginica]
MTNRRHCFDYRRRHPELFPFYCESCVPQRRFKLPPHKAQHDKDKHGITTPILSHNYPQGATFSALTLHPPPRSVSATSSPLSALSARELNTFVQTELEPDTEYNKSCNAVVDRLCQFMQNNFPDVIRPSEVRKAGSLGKGTAVKGKSDADLVVFLANFHTISDLRVNLPSIFARMKRYLGEYGGCDVTGTTPHAVQVSVHCHGHSHDADILPSVNILKTKTLHEIYKEMDLEPRFQHFYSAALAPLQIDFVSQVPPKVKNLIRLMKFWKKTEFEDSVSDPDRKLPSSYLLELIVINEWKRAGSPQNFDLRKGFYQVLTAITNYRTMRLASTQNYTSHHIRYLYTALLTSSLTKCQI